MIEMGQDSPRSRIGIGVIGCGTVAEAVHLPSLKEIPEAEIIAVVDIDGRRAKEVSEKFGAEYYTDYHMLLKRRDIDAVVVALPNRLHVEPAVAAAEAGKHILLQKPMATNLKDCDRMLEAARSAGIKLIPIFMWRFRADVELAKKLIDEGLIGEVFTLRGQFGHTGAYNMWFYDAEKSGGGALIDLGVHHVDILRWFAGDVRSVMAMTAIHKRRRKLPSGLELDDMSVEDDAACLLRFKNDALGILVSSWTQKAGFQGFEVYGNQGTIILDARVGELKLYSDKVIPERMRIRALPFGIDISGPRLSFTMQQLYTALPTPAIKAHRHFIECLLGDKTPIANGKDARAAVEIVEAGYESARTGKEITLPLKY